MSKLVIMEFGGVVCNQQTALKRARERVNLILTQCGIDGSEFWRLYEDVEPQLQSAVIDGFLSDDEYEWHRFADVCQRLTNCVGILPTAIGSVFAEETVRKASLFDDVLPAFSRLHEAGYRVVVVAPGLSSIQREIFRVTRLGEVLENRRFYVSEELGLLGSDGEFLRAVLHDNGFAPSEAIFVGSNLESSVWSAETHGVRGILLDRESEMGVAYAGERAFSLEGLVSMLLGETLSGDSKVPGVEEGSVAESSLEEVPFLV
jgi:FMN phosphatase YigB (HAD superfamily)